MNKEPQEDLENMKQKCLKSNRRKRKALITLSVIAIIGVSAFFVFYYFGFIPMGLTVKEPVGNVETIDVGSYIEEFPEIAEMPNLEKLEYAAYSTDASATEIDEGYEEELLNEGYHVEYSGSFELEGVTFEAKGYLKGLTAVAILTTDESTELSDYDSLVLYATGNALDFQEILNWYQNK